MRCRKALLSYEDKQINLTIQLNDEEYDKLLSECRRENKNVEDFLIEACDMGFKHAEGKSDND